MSNALDMDITLKSEWHVPRTDTEGRRDHVRRTPSASPFSRMPAAVSLSTDSDRLRCSPSGDSVNLRLLARNLGLCDWTKESEDTCRMNFSGGPDPLSSRNLT